MKPKRIVLGAALLILAAAIAIQFRHVPEPVYQGRRLTQWLKQEEADNSTTNHEVCEQAIRAIGTNGIPTLLKLLDTKETPGFGHVQEFVESRGWMHFHWFDSSYKPRLGAIGFWALREAGKPAQTNLAELARPGGSPLTTVSALWCLEAIKADRQVLVPLLVQNLTNSDPKIATYVISRLPRVAPEVMTNLQSNANKK